MPSTYTSRLRLTLPATGELINTWGTTVNTGITELVDASIAGAATISTWGGAGIAYTLSNNNGVADEARCMFIVASGAPGENKNIICPAVSKLYVVVNSVTGGYTVTLKTAAGTGITVENGKTAVLRCDGTNVVNAITQLPAFVVAGGTANQVQYLNASKELTGSANLTFNGTSLTLGGNPTLTAGTANGVLYLNGSKVATSGSALTFDGTNLGLQVTPNTWSTTTSVFENPSGCIYTFSGNNQIGLNSNAYYNGTNWIYRNASSVPAADYFLQNGQFVWRNSVAGTSGNIIAYSEQMRLTSTGLGIGTSSPLAKLDVRSGATTFAAQIDSTGINTYAATTSTSLTNTTLQLVGGGASGATTGIRLSQGGSFEAYFGGVQESGGAAAFVWQGYSGSAYSERMRLDSSGNLGLGVTPSAWGNTYKAIQLGLGGALFGRTGVARQVGLSANAYDGGSGSIYMVSGQAATSYLQDSGIHYWFTAPSGTAGNAITFTQAMTLDASGNLAVGTTSPPAYGSKLRVEGGIESFSSQFNVSSGTSTQFELVNRSATAGFDFYVNSGGTLAARITSGGELCIGTTAAATGARLTVNGVGSTNATFIVHFANSSTTRCFAVEGAGRILTGTAAESPYNNTTASAANMFVDSAGVLFRSTSSLKYKTDVQNATHGLAEVMQLRPVTYKGKNDGDTVFGGLIAEEVHAAGLTEFVQYAEDGSPDALAYGNMVSLLTKAIQEQQALITDLRARVAALEAA